MGRKPTNLSGGVFNDLTVVGISAKRNTYGRSLYECVCKCGNIVYATFANLKRGEIKMCKTCKSEQLRIDITGKTFGKLQVISFVEMRDRKSMWLCKCECGKETIVMYGGLTGGKTTSCGCMRIDRVKSLYVDNTAPCKLSESKKPRINNTSGHTGVWYDKARQRWVAEIMLQGKKHSLGRFRDKDDAVKARERAEEKLFEPYLKESKAKDM